MGCTHSSAARTGRTGADVLKEARLDDFNSAYAKARAEPTAHAPHGKLAEELPTTAVRPHRSSTLTGEGIDRGVSLKLLRLIRGEAIRLAAYEGPLREDRHWEKDQGYSRRAAGEALTTEDFAREHVKPKTRAAASSYATLLLQPEAAAAAGLLGSAKHVGPATIFVSHAWQYKIAEQLIDAIEAYVEKNGLDEDSTYFWIDNLVVNQHDVGGTKPPDYWATTFRASVKAIGRTLLVLAPAVKPIPLTRAWCLFEIFCTCNTGDDNSEAASILDVTMPPAEVRAFGKALLEDFSSISTQLAHVDLRDAKAWSEDDRQSIVGAVRDGRGFPALNQIVLDKMREWQENTARSLLADAKTRWQHAAAGALTSQAMRDSFNAGEKQLVTQNPKMAKVMEDVQKLKRFELEEKVAKLLDHHGNFEEAERYGREALAGNAEVLGPHHKRTLRSMDSLGNLLKHEGLALEANAGSRASRIGEAAAGAALLKEAEKLLRESCLARQESDPNLKDPETLRAMASLGHLLDAEGKLEDGEHLLEQALEGECRLHGIPSSDPVSLARWTSDHSKDGSNRDVLKMMSSLGQLKMHEKKYDEAEALLRADLDAEVAAWGERDFRTLIARSELSQCLKELGRLDEAYDVLMGPNEDAPYIAQSVLGPAHPKTIQMLDRMRQIGKAPKGSGQGASGLAHREQMAEHREAFALAVVRESSAFNLNEPSVGGDALAGLREDSVDATVEADEETSARRTLTNDRGRRLGLDVTRRTGSGSVLTPHVALREKAEAQRQSRLKEKMRKARRKMSAGAALLSPVRRPKSGKEKLAWTA